MHQKTITVKEVNFGKLEEDESQKDEKKELNYLKSNQKKKNWSVKNSKTMRADKQLPKLLMHNWGTNLEEKTSKPRLKREAIWRGILLKTPNACPHSSNSSLRTLVQRSPWSLWRRQNLLGMINWTLDHNQPQNISDDL